MSEVEGLELEQIDEESTGCPDGDQAEIPEDCPECEPVEFCSTLVFPAGFSLPPDVIGEDYIEENFDIAGYFIEGCFECEQVECSIETDELNCGPITAIQTVVQGTIKYLSSLCLVSESAPEAGAQAAISDTGFICIEEETPVCIGCQGSCEELRVVGATNVEATNVGESCGREIWEVTGQLQFACEPAPVEEDNNNNNDNNNQ